MNSSVSDNPQISEIWTARIYYKGKSGSNKPRPILIINLDEDNNLYTIQEITSVPPKDSPSHFDHYKQIIEKWKESGLDEKSYVKCAPTNTHKVDKIRLKNYVGVTDEDDFEAIINKIVEVKSKFNK